MGIPWLDIGLGAASAYGQYQANQANQRLSREQMKFQERMSSTAYQRATADMRAAGLNPMLAFQQGGASSPVGSAPEVRDVVSPGVSGAASAKQMRILNEQARLVREQRYKAEAEASTAWREYEMMYADPNQGVDSRRGIEWAAQLDRTRAEAWSARAGAKLNVAREPYQWMMSIPGRFARYVQQQLMNPQPPVGGLRRPMDER